MSVHEVRQARRGELPTVLALATAFYAEDGFSTPVSQLCDNLLVLLDSDSARVAVACGPADEIVGLAITTCSFGLEQGCVAELEDLFVRPTHRRNGIAGALIEDSAQWARSHRCRALELVVAPNGNDVAHLFGYYARRGFVDEGRRLLSRNLVVINGDTTAPLHERTGFQMSAGRTSEAVAALLDQVRSASGGRLLGLHNDLARSPAPLAAYLGIRRAGVDYATLDPAVRAAIMLTVGAVNGGEYSQAIATQLAIRAGMSEQQTVTTRAGQVEDSRTAALLAVMREAAANSGVVSKKAWNAATAAGWNEEQLYEGFVHLALTVYCDYFTNFANTRLDVPAAPPIQTQKSVT